MVAAVVGGDVGGEMAVAPGGDPSSSFLCFSAFFFLFFLCFSLLFSFDLQLLPSSVLLLPLSFFFSTIFPIFIGKIGEREARAATVQPP